MTSVTNDGFVKMWSEEQPPVLLSEIILPMSTDDLNNLFCDQFAASVKKIAALNKGIVYVICDATRLQYFTFELLLQCLKNLLKPSLQLRFCAIIKPKSIKSLKEITRILVEMKNVPVEVIETIQEARTIINGDWIRLRAAER